MSKTSSTCQSNQNTGPTQVLDESIQLIGNLYDNWLWHAFVNFKVCTNKMLTKEMWPVPVWQHCVHSRQNQTSAAVNREHMGDKHQDNIKTPTDGRQPRALLRSGFFFFTYLGLITKMRGSKRWIEFKDARQMDSSDAGPASSGRN